MPSEPSRFVLSLPKAELHLHLEGSIEPSTLLELRRRHGMGGASLAEVDQLYNYKDFTGFLTAFKDVTGHLRTPEDYELITCRLMERLKSQNVLHAEVIVSAGVCLWRKQDFAAIFEGLERGRERGEKDFGISLLWIFDAVRQFGADKAQSARARRSGSRRFTLAPRSTVFISRLTPVKKPGRSPSGAR
jgi:adenosine deaminase/aminodeoxyfutalosine deaminase